MTETPKFSLLNAARNQNANSVVKHQAPSAPSQPIQKSEVQESPKPGSLLGGRSLLGGTAKSTQTKPTESIPVKPAENQPVPTTSLAAHSAATKGGLLGGLEKARAHQEATKAEHDKLFTEPPKDFRELLDSFDKFFAADTGISEFNLQPARDFVERIFQDLRVDPSLDGLMLDKDVANVIEWVRKVKGEALAAGVNKKEKAQKAKEKTKPKDRFGELGGSLNMAILPDSLKDMSDFGEFS